MANYLKNQRNMTVNAKPTQQKTQTNTSSVTTMSSVASESSQVPSFVSASEPIPMTVPMQRPARKKFEEEVAKLTGTIKAKEVDLASLQQQSTGIACREENLHTIWQQREEIIARCRAVDQRLQAANKDLTLKRDALAKIHSTLNYKSEDRINGAIARLEYQLRVNNFKVHEEKRIVMEIDTLNRSRRNLKEYLQKKAELDVVCKEMQEMRNERDVMYRAMKDLKQEGDTFKRENKERKTKLAALKQELDDLYAEKRHLVTTFRQNFSKHQQSRVEIKRQMQKKDLPQDSTPPEILQPEAFSKERHLCQTLLHYLGRYECKSITSALTPSMANNDFLTNGSISEGHTPVSPTDEGKILRRKEECFEDDLQCPWSSARGARAKRNHTKKIRHQQMKKPITHTPEVFEQFSRLQLCAPSLMTEVPVAIEQLKAKKKFYDHLSQAGAIQDVPHLPLYSLSCTNVNTKRQDICQLSEPDKQEVSQIKDGPAEGPMTDSNPGCESTVQCKVTRIRNQSTNIVPNSLDLGQSAYVAHLSDIVHQFDDLDKGYSSGNGYLNLDSKSSKVQNVDSLL